MFFAYRLLKCLPPMTKLQKGDIMILFYCYMYFAVFTHLHPLVDGDWIFVNQEKVIERPLGLSHQRIMQEFIIQHLIESLMINLLL